MGACCSNAAAVKHGVAPALPPHSARGTSTAQAKADAEAAVLDAALPPSITPLLQAAYDVDVHAPLGKGSFGVVFRGVHRTSGDIAAVKVMDRARIKASSIVREHTVLSHLGRHPFVVDYYGSFRVSAMHGAVGFSAGHGHGHSGKAVVPAGASAHVQATGAGAQPGAPVQPSSSAEGSVAFAFELMRGGELFERLIKHGAVPEADARIRIGQLASALRYLHARGIVHRGESRQVRGISASGAHARRRC